MSLEQAIAREHIRDTLARYNIAGDGRDLAAFVATFTDDAVYESAVFECTGRANIESYLRAAWAAKPTGPTARFRRHNLTTCQIDLTGPTTANSRTYYFVVSDLGPDHSGYYVDRWREEQGRWLMTHREVWMDWCHLQSLYVPEQSKRMLAEMGACGPQRAIMAGRR
jgi:3-phenylpropionate/cinnamic acid dioxygenase small subunit